MGHSADLGEWDGGGEVEVEFKDKGDAFRDAEAAVAESVALAVRAGLTVEEAAEAAGQDVSYVRAMPKAKAVLKALKAEYELNNEEMRQLVKAKAVEHAIEGEPKQSMDALKLLAAMPDVGLTPSYNGGKVQVNVGVFSEETTRVLASLETEAEGQ